jgi:serine/threonine protein kinase
MASPAEYWIGATIGEGSFGVVLHGRHKVTNLDCAVKAVDKVSLAKNKSQALAVVNEQRILKQLKGCEYVVNLYASFHDNECVYIVTECCTGGTLQDVVLNEKSSDDATAASCRYYGLQILEALSQLHATFNIVHCDLKPTNILLTDKGRIKLADFGCALQTDPPNTIPAAAAAAAAHSLSIPRGTTAFSAPEILKNNTITASADLWSFGCILFALKFGKSPFEAESDALMVHSIQEYCKLADVASRTKKIFGDETATTTTTIDKEMPHLWKNLIVALLHPDPDKRNGTKTTTNSQTNNAVVMLDVTAATVYPSIRENPIWEGVDLSKDPIDPPARPKWWQEVDKTPMKDGAQGWSAFLVQ